MISTKRITFFSQFNKTILMTKEFKNICNHSLTLTQHSIIFKKLLLQILHFYQINNKTITYKEAVLKKNTSDCPC